eukprot:5410124-Prymnesium_polylepis.1
MPHAPTWQCPAAAQCHAWCNNARGAARRHPSKRASTSAVKKMEHTVCRVQEEVAVHVTSFHPLVVSGVVGSLRDAGFVSRFSELPAASVLRDARALSSVDSSSTPLLSTRCSVLPRAHPQPH